MSKICIEDTTFYNKGSSVLLGWDPTWFGLDKNEFGEELEEAIKDFQSEYNIKIDGLVGPVTYTRMVTEREAEENSNISLINCGLKQIALPYAKVDDTYYHKLPLKNYKIVDLNKQRNINKIVVHWDAALSTSSCFEILKKRGYSSHFSIDNDGTIYQFLNTNHIAYHVKETNDNAIGIDISNAFYTKYNSTYEKRGFGKRPVIRSKVNGKDIGEHLGYYPAQIQAAKSLIAVLCDTYNIPLQVPKEFLTDPKNTSGVMFHYHINNNKIDTAGFPLELIINEIKLEK